MSKKPAAETGGKRMAKLGYKPSQLWYTQEEYDLSSSCGFACPASYDAICNHRHGCGSQASVERS